MLWGWSTSGAKTAGTDVLGERESTEPVTALSPSRPVDRSAGHGRVHCRTSQNCLNARARQAMPSALWGGSTLTNQGMRWGWSSRLWPS